MKQLRLVFLKNSLWAHNFCSSSVRLPFRMVCSLQPSCQIWRVGSLERKNSASFILFRYTFPLPGCKCRLFQHFRADELIPPLAFLFFVLTNSFFFDGLMRSNAWFLMLVAFYFIYSSLLRFFFWLFSFIFV